jgi:molybdenum cofactor cytidylyltransferase
MIVGVLLAAGAGTRFGGGKLLHKLPDGTPIAVAAAASLVPACDRVIAVIRAGDDELATLLTQAGCGIVVCDKAEQGMGHSLAAGVQASADASAWLVALADMPYIATATHQAVAACLRSGASLAASQYRGKRGHPVGFSSAWRIPLTALTGDQGARALLGAHSDSVTLCAVDDVGILRDIDRREDL